MGKPSIETELAVHIENFHHLKECSFIGSKGASPLRDGWMDEQAFLFDERLDCIFPAVLKKCMSHFLTNDPLQINLMR